MVMRAAVNAVLFSGLGAAKCDLFSGRTARDANCHAVKDSHAASYATRAVRIEHGTLLALSCPPGSTQAVPQRSVPDEKGSVRNMGSRNQNQRHQFGSSDRGRRLSVWVVLPISLGWSAAAIAAPAVGEPSLFTSIDPAAHQINGPAAAHSIVQAMEARDRGWSKRHALVPVGAQSRTQRFQDWVTDGVRKIEVLGSIAFRHQDGDRVDQDTSQLARFDLDLTPALSEAIAVSVAQGVTGERAIGSPTLKVLPSEEFSNRANLVYVVPLETGSAYVDTQDGQLLLNEPYRIEVAIAPINVIQVSDACQKVDEMGDPISLLPEKCDKVVSDSRALSSADEEAMQAFENAQRTLVYFANTHGRESYDDMGSPVTSFVHIGKEFDNAFWDQRTNTMAYGDGDGKTFRPFTAALDVAGHEMTHGVVAKTAKLVYAGQSGALNEAYADIFGKMIADDGDWMMGRSLFITQGPKAGIRNLQTPELLDVEYRDDLGRRTSKPYPKSFSERFVAKDACGRHNDQCWVHVNSTIWSHGAYLVHQAVGREAMERIYYDVLTRRLGARATFRVAADQTLKACAALYADGVCQKVETALAQVGLGPRGYVANR